MLFRPEISDQLNKKGYQDIPSQGIQTYGQLQEEVYKVIERLKPKDLRIKSARMLGFALLETGPGLCVAELNDAILGAGLAGEAGELCLAALRVAEAVGEAPEEAKGGDRLFAQDEVPHSITLGTNTSLLLLSRSEDRSRLEPPAE